MITLSRSIGRRQGWRFPDRRRKPRRSALGGNIRLRCDRLAGRHRRSKRTPAPRSLRRRRSSPSRSRRDDPCQSSPVGCVLHWRAREHTDSLSPGSASTRAIIQSARYRPHQSANRHVWPNPGYSLAGTVGAGRHCGCSARLVRVNRHGLAAMFIEHRAA